MAFLLFKFEKRTWTIIIVKRHQHNTMPLNWSWGSVLRQQVLLKESSLRFIVCHTFRLSQAWVFEFEIKLQSRVRRTVKPSFDPFPDFVSLPHFSIMFVLIEKPNMSVINVRIISMQVYLDKFM